jgi:hypothetical protein
MIRKSRDEEPSDIAIRHDAKERQADPPEFEYVEDFSGWRTTQMPGYRSPQ